MRNARIGLKFVRVGFFAMLYTSVDSELPQLLDQSVTDVVSEISFSVFRVGTGLGLKLIRSSVLSTKNDVDSHSIFLKTIGTACVLWKKCVFCPIYYSIEHKGSS